MTTPGCSWPAPPTPGSPARDVVSTFLATIAAHGAPAATLTDNGAVYTSRFTGGRNGFEYLLASSASPNATATPATHKPRAKSNASTRPSNAGSPPNRPPPTWPNCNTNSTASRPLYNTAAASPRPRPHTPAAGLRRHRQSRPARPATAPRAPTGVRVDTIDRHGKLSLRRAGRMHHLGIGARHAGTAALVLIRRPTPSRSSTQPPAKLLSSHTIDPTRSYWRNTQTTPGRWPRAL